MTLAADMRVAVFNADEGGCGWYRLLYPAQALRNAGHDIVLGPSLPSVRDDHPVLGDYLVDVHLDADVAVFQRPCKRELVEAIPVLQRRGVAVVVEIDDDLHALPKGHPARRDFAPRHHPDRNWRWLAQACALADMVTTTTSALAERYGGHGRVTVLPNCVPAWYFDVQPRRTPGRVMLGWPGSPVTHTGDLEMLGSTVADVVRHTRCSFRAIGSAQTLQVLDVQGELVEWAELTDRGPAGYAAMVGQLDVGMVPLVDSPFTAAKSWLKGLEMAALGVAFVASPRAEYVRLAERGAGVLAETLDDWDRELTRLVVDEGWRFERVARGRAAVASLTYERRADEWWGAWVRAAENRAGSLAA